MDSFELNKIIAAVLLVALLIIGLGKLSDIIFHVEKPKTPGYVVEVEKVVASNITSTAEASEETINIAALMEMGDLATGEKVLKNVLLVIQSLKVVKITLVLHFIMLLVEKLEPLMIINILKHSLNMVKNGHLKN